MVRHLGSTFDPLERFSGFGLARLLPLHNPGIPSKQPCWPEEISQLWIIALESLADAVSDSLLHMQSLLGNEDP